MRKTLLMSATTLCLLLLSCGSPASSSASSSQKKGEEVVRTVDKATWEKLITNAGVINPPTNVTLHIEVEGGQTGTIKIEYLNVEVAFSYGEGEPIPNKYYTVMEDSAYLFIMDPSGKEVLDKRTITRDEALSGLVSAVGLFGSSFVYEQFAYVESSGSYHCDLVNVPSGNSMHDVNFSFENGLLVSAFGKQEAGDPSNLVGVSLKADSYGSTSVTAPYWY